MVAGFVGRAFGEFGRASLFDKILTVFYVFVPLALLARFADLSPIATFFICALAIVPLAKLLGEATESIASKMGATLGGLLNATFGNAVELIIAIIALSKGIPEVVKASITGSIIGNILFVLGLSMFFGGLGYKNQRFNRYIASSSASQMTLACIALIVPSVFVATSGRNDNLPSLVENLSLLVSVILLVSYAAQLFFTLRTHSKETADEELPEGLQEYENEIAKTDEVIHGSAWGVKRSLITLVIATVTIGMISETLVGSIEPLTKELGWTELFVGVILVAIIGNAAEHLTAVTVAMKNKMTLALSISIGSAAQIALFVAPVLVFVGFFMGGNSQLDLYFGEFELIAIVVSVVIMNLVTQDNESNWFEGLQLLAAYAILGIAFYLHPPVVFPSLK
ncbi:calcium/proton exchanger [Candidatus Chlorohelix sp.]|uniref:calcium/proton exchanger n=1 Tax=Candidatus Chlorohelix sp. TaxID=3139201 RepID=UPI00305A0EDC